MKDVIDMLYKRITTFLLILFLFITSNASEKIVDGHPSNMLRVLGIMEGYPDGTFKGENYITRAEMAKIFCYMWGIHLRGTILQRNTIFSDVTSEHWASGYIWIAEMQEIINGIGDGTFRPDDPITYEQAIKMIVITLGYSAHAELKGGYPNGYIDVAEDLDITTGMKFMQTDFATRSDIATFVEKAMEIPFWSKITYYAYEPTLNEKASMNRNERNYTILEYLSNIPNSLFHYFNAFESSDYETMKQYSTDGHIADYFNDDNVWDIKSAKLINVIAEEFNWGKDVYICLVEIETEEHSDVTKNFYVLIELTPDFEFKIDKFETEIENLFKPTT